MPDKIVATFQVKFEGHKSNEFIALVEADKKHKAGFYSCDSKGKVDYSKPVDVDAERVQVKGYDYPLIIDLEKSLSGKTLQLNAMSSLRYVGANYETYIAADYEKYTHQKQNQLLPTQYADYNGDGKTDNKLSNQTINSWLDPLTKLPFVTETIIHSSIQITPTYVPKK